MSNKTRKKAHLANIYTVEDHNDVLQYIYKEIGARRLQFSSLIMIHFDSHPDLGAPSNINADLVFEKNVLLDNLSIENWIFPAVYAGHIETIVWIKPKWAEQIKSGLFDLTIGKDKATGLIKCNCKESYFLSDNLYQNESELENKRTFCLYVCDFDAIINNPDECLYRILSSIDREQKRIILDIDLDFFSTKDPFREMFHDLKYYELFRDVYYQKFDGEQNDLDFDKKYSKFLELKNNKLELIYNFLSEKLNSSSLEDGILKDEKLDELATIFKRENIDIEIIHSYGSGLDEHDLPHHVSSTDQIEKMINDFSFFINKYLVSMKLSPSIITIARSSLDGYCPDDQVEFIQEEIISKIKKDLGNLIGDVNKNYD
jgi:hypothetical protein